jgi:DNA gyrase subunit A
MDSATSVTHTINIEDEMRQSYMDYAMSVIVGRALPDIRDGLKPVQRRVLYAMMREGLTSDKKTSKCAGVVGEVLKTLHPHGDMSVYDALVRLAQPWCLRYPLVDGQGNFGSVDGDPAAAYRYTECRMSAIAERLLQDIDKETVDFIPNFDDSSVEPVVLPTVVPNLLINGADGIAVGMATHIPPHNLAEVVTATIALINNPQMALADLLQIIPGPDFPTGGLIYGRAAIVSAFTTGKGVLQLRARTSIEQLKGKSREVEAIVVTEIPFQVNKARLVEKIADLINDKLIEGISKLRDESDKSGMRIVMELKKDATSEVVLNQLFKLTPMQTSFGVINLSIVEGKPVVCSLADMIRHFIDHRRDVVTRRTQFDLRKAKERMHLLDGFRIALLNLDAVIELIRSSQTPKEAKEGLQARYELSPLQAQAILDMRLQRLTGMERLAIEKEHQELAQEIEELMLILSDPKRVDAIIVGELSEIKDRFGDDRRTEIVDAGAEIDIQDLIEEEDVVVTLTHAGYIKRTSLSLYREQKRGGKGVTGATAKDEDFVDHLYVTSTHSNLLVFTSLGRVFWQKVYQIPEVGRAARGRALVNLLNLRPDETMTAILPIREFVENNYILMATRSGVVKKVDLMEFSRSRPSGLVACTLKEGDALIGVAVTGGKDDIILATKSGMAIRFNEDDVRAMGRTATGVRGIRFDESDAVVSMTVIPAQLSETDASRLTLLTVCENGYGKRTVVTEYRTQSRGGKGLIDIQTEDRNGPVVSVELTGDNNGLMLITSSGKIIRIISQAVSVIGRNTKGVRLINLDEGEKVVGMALQTSAALAARRPWCRVIMAMTAQSRTR